MKPGAITYENMVTTMLRELPELKPLYDRELERRGEEIGQHIMYRYVMYAAIEEQLKSQSRPDAALLKKVFAFLESLIEHPEAHVREVAHQSVCDKICSDEVVLQKAQPFMGKKTKVLCLSISGGRPK